MRTQRFLLGTLFALAGFALTTAPAWSADAAAGKKTYDAMCVTCHGASGKGDGPAGAALKPPPRDFTDAAWQKEVSDDRIAKAIKDGGPAVGVAPTMPPFGGSLNETQVKNLVAYIRSLNGK